MTRIIFSGVCGQLSLGGANSFLPEHLDAAAAITTTGKTLEVTPLVDASTTNAGADAAAAAAAAAEPASDSDLPGASHADGSLTAATTAPPEETTLPDFDDYTADETETTTEHLSSPENHISLTEEADTPDSSAHSKHNAEKLATDAPILTRRIVFTGPEATAAAPQPADQSTRPSSVVRGLDNPSTDFWLPNWPTQLLTNTEEASRRPTVRFPSGSPTAVPGTEAAPPVTPTQSYTVTKVPVTQYYFDLASASPSDIPGPLFDHEDLGVSVSALPSALPDLTQPLAAEDLASSISELQSSVLVNLNGPPLTSTPALHDSVTSAVLATDGPHSISDSTATPTLPAPSSALNEVVGEHIVDNTLPEDAENEGDVAVRETTETPEVLPPPISTNQSGVEDSDHSENITVNDDPSGLQSPTEASDTPEPTSTPQPDAPSPAGPAPPTDSEPVTATSSPTPGTVKPSSVRTSQAAKTSRIPLWQLLSQSSPPRPASTPPPSTPLTSPVTVAPSPPAADSVTPLANALPHPQSTSIEPLSALDDSPAPPPPTFTPSSQDTEFTPESPLPDDSDPSTPLDSNDPDQVLTKTLRSEFEDVNFKSSELNITDSESAKPPFVEGYEPEFPELLSFNNPTNSSLSLNPNTVVSNANIDVHNALDDTHTNIFSGDNTPPENNTQHENAIPDDTKVVENDPLMSSVEEERDVAMVSPAGVLVSPPPATASATWTPVVDVSEGHTDTESTSVPASSSVLTSTTLVSPSPPELLSGFTPIISSTQTSPTPNSEAPEGTHTSLSSSTAATLDSTTTASAPTQDLSTLSAPTPTLSSALDLPAVQKTDRESPGNNTSVAKTIDLSVKTIDESLPSHDDLATPHMPETEDTTSVASWAPTVTDFLIETSALPNVIVPELEATVLGSLPEPTILATESPSSPSVASPEILPSPSQTSVPVQTLPVTHTNLSSVNLVAVSLPQPSASPVLPELLVTSSPPVPHDAPKSLASVFYQAVPESTPFPITPDVQMSSSAIPVPLDHTVSSALPDAPLSSSVLSFPELPVSSVTLDVPQSSPVSLPADAPMSSAVPAIPEAPVSSVLPDNPEFSVTVDAQVSSTVPVPTDVPESSVAPVSSSAVPILPPDVPVSSASVAILPTPSIHPPASDSPTLVAPTATDDPSPTLLPEPVQPEEGAEEGTQQEVPEKGRFILLPLKFVIFT